jgi:hypothetical protein
LGESGSRLAGRFTVTGTQTFRLLANNLQSEEEQQAMSFSPDENQDDSSSSSNLSLSNLRPVDQFIEFSFFGTFQLSLDENHRIASAALNYQGWSHQIKKIL